jgi:hypothetical protein
MVIVASSREILTTAADNGPKINLAIAELGAAGGGTLLFDPPDDPNHPAYRIQTTIQLGNGSINGPSTINGVRLVGVGSPLGPSGYVNASLVKVGTRLLWTGAMAGRVVNVNGPCTSNSMENIVIDGGTSADYGLTILSLQSSSWKDVQVCRCRHTAITIDIQRIPDENINPTNFVSARATADNVFDNLQVDGFTGVEGMGVTCLKIDGWTATNTDPCRNIFRGFKQIVDLTHNTTLGRAGIGYDLGFCDSNSFPDSWQQGLGTANDPTTASGILLRGVIVGADPLSNNPGTAYPTNNVWSGKYQAGQKLPRTFTDVPGLNYFPMQEADREDCPTWPVSRFVAGQKPEFVRPAAPLNHTSEYGLSRIRDEDRNGILNSGLLRAYRPTTVTNPASGAPLLDANLWLEFDGQFSCTVSRVIAPPGQVDIPFEPRYGLRIDATAASGMTSLSLNWAVTDLVKFAGRRVNFSAFLKQDAPRNLAVVAAQIFGTGGSPSDAVIAPSIEGAQNVGATYQRYRWRFDYPSLAGETLGAADDHWNKIGLALPLNTPFSLEIWLPQFERGEADTPWYSRGIETEATMLSRYLQLLDAPGDVYGFGRAINATTVELMADFTVQMARAPNLISKGSAAQFLLNGQPCTSLPTLAATPRRGCLIFTGAGLTPGAMVRISRTGDASLMLSAEYI